MSKKPKVDRRAAEVEELMGWRVAYVANMQASGEISVEGPLADGWRVSGRFVKSGDALLLAEVKVFPAGDRHRAQDGQIPTDLARRSPHLEIGAWSLIALTGLYKVDGPLTSDLLRRVPFQRLHDEAWALLTGLRATGHPDDEAVEAAFGEALRNAIDRPGRAGRPDSYFAIWAWRYVRAVAEPDRTTGPVATLAERHSKTPNQVRMLIATARARELLETYGPGRPGGRLTEKAKSSLQEIGVQL